MHDKLAFKQDFKQQLATEIEKVLNAKVKIGEQFESWDSYAFLITTEDGKKYVGKIFRYVDWPPKGKLEEITKLLAQNNIVHENTIYLTHSHPLFTFGWQLTDYIQGGNAIDALTEKVATKDDYLKKVTEKLKLVHNLEFNFYGSLIDKNEQHPTFQKLAEEELSYHTFIDLPSNFKHFHEVIEAAKKEIHQLLNKLTFTSTLVHDDAGTRNIMWNNGDPILIDWVDAIAGPALRDFATLTYREDAGVLNIIEKAYGQEINQEELRLHQLMRFIRLGHFKYYEDHDKKDFELLMTRLEILLERSVPFGF